MDILHVQACRRRLGMQERRGRVKAARQRREEAEDSGEALQRTSCDSITQVQRTMFHEIIGSSHM